MKKKVLSLVAIVALVAILGVVLCSCNADSYKDKLEDEGYSVTVYDKDSDGFDEINDQIKEKYEGGIKWEVTAAKASLSGSGLITIIKFAKTKDAKQYVEDLGGESDTLVRKAAIVFAGDADSIDIVA